MTGPSIAEGLIFDDLNGDKKYDLGEPTRAGVTAFIDVNGNARLDAGETNITTSGADGRFRLVGPFPDSSYIAVIDPLNPTGPAQL